MCDSRINGKEIETKSGLKIINPEDWHRVEFIGISNWVLDPAKMKEVCFFVFVYIMS